MIQKLPFSVSVVIPVYNAADRIEFTIHKLCTHLSSAFSTYELILIDDASNDESPEIVRKISAANPNIRQALHTINQGQQITIAEGLLLARYEIVLTVDADLPCSTEDLSAMAQIAYTEVEIVFCRRQSRTRGVWWRTIGSKLVNGVFRVLYHYEIRDFGCGVAAMRQSLINKLRSADRPIGLIKIDLLSLAETYREMEFSSYTPRPFSRSSYSFRKLFSLFWQLLLYKVR